MVTLLFIVNQTTSIIWHNMLYTIYTLHVAFTCTTPSNQQMIWLPIALGLSALFIYSGGRTLQADAILRRAFGLDASPLKEHFDELFQAVITTRNSKKPSVGFRPPYHHICCSTLAVSEALAHVNSHSFRIIYASQMPRLVCLISNEPFSILASIPQNVFSYIVPVERFLTIHPSVMQMAEYIREHGDAGNDPVSLDLTCGIGTQRLGISQVRATRFVEVIHQRLQSNDHGQALQFARESGAMDDNILPSYSPGSWLSFIRSMSAFVHLSQSRGESASSVCDYDVLELTCHPRGIRVRGVERLRRPECLILLAAHLIMVTEDAFAVSVVTTTNAPSNNFRASLLRKSPAVWRRVYDMSPNSKLLFVHIPKCGGTYAAQILKVLNISNNFHSKARQKNSVTFGIVRHPVERFESFLNYRLGEWNVRKDWPRYLRHAHKDKQASLNDIVLAFRTADILRFAPFKTLLFWTQKIDILITINQLEDFLQFWGYRYNSSSFMAKNISPKTRGTLNITARAKVEDVFRRDLVVYRTVLQQYVH